MQFSITLAVIVLLVALISWSLARRDDHAIARSGPIAGIKNSKRLLAKPVSRGDDELRWSLGEGINLALKQVGDGLWLWLFDGRDVLKTLTGHASLRRVFVLSEVDQVIETINAMLSVEPLKAHKLMAGQPV